MKHFLLPLFISLILISHSFGQSYNNLWIPDTLSGTNFNLRIVDTFAQIVNTGNQTITGGINGKFWGPTIFVNKGDMIQMNVQNKLKDSVTIHWHGMHLPAVMDGGPYQIIPPNTIWKPYWTIKNEAATYWYHPHLHEMTMEQITKGIGGLLIVRDAKERSLALPRKYGVDDIPLVLTDRDFNSSNQFSIVPYGDSMLTNMTLRAKFDVPAQVVRFRILNAAIERSYNIGFSDGRTFYVITSDGGLLNAPVAKTRYLLHAGERIEILVDLTNQNGAFIDLKAYNSSLGNNIPGGENFVTGPFGNFLGKKDFNILRINVIAPTVNPITTIPNTLAANTYLKVSDAQLTRQLTISDSMGFPNILGPNAFLINRKPFKLNYNEYNVPLNNTEIWQITSSSIFGHPFHIHDVEFNILSINGVAPDATQAGWKDVVFVPGRTGGTSSVVKFITKFDDFADPLHPFMYHCHIALHEDEGMMGQFIVSNPTATNNLSFSSNHFTLFPNPAQDRLFIRYDSPNHSAYYIKIIDALGRTKLMLPQPQVENGIDIQSLKTGMYHLLLTDEHSKTTSSSTFIKTE
jgi:blue copper oxidase